MKQKNQNYRLLIVGIEINDIESIKSQSAQIPNNA
jgi:hypothetical protein